MMESILNTLNSIKSANYHFNKFLVSFGLVTSEFLQKTLPDDFTLPSLAGPALTGLFFISE